MTADELARSYIAKAGVRAEMLDFLAQRGAWSDVVRVAQESVELALKAMLRHVGVDPPKWHDVGSVLLEQSHLFAADVQERLPELARISKRLRKDRELAFYGDIDFIPTREYGPPEGRAAMEEARIVLDVARRVVL
jgi:HEPN domain-containing protein